jgi:hypothetical protein
MDSIPVQFELEQHYSAPRTAVECNINSIASIAAQKAQQLYNKRKQSIKFTELRRGRCARMSKESLLSTQAIPVIICIIED